MSMRAKGMVLLIIGLVCASCAKSEEEIQDEFDAIVAESNACNDASECVYATPGCPLGCFVAVNSAKKAYVEEEARALIEDYERFGRYCAYECVAPGPLECTAGRCQEGDASP
ncbi:hypothetical protein BE20_24400 [Sorangium cellulosum]|uniref:Secreted protein n=1 Tax=Sorangium cellulosum TaxID=56 RepID=A0A150S616_SORCE|nr:hypothetical protein BE18_48725 [Sorangium cellulosum]KYF87923.1 hypothetical protein BE20_24400 [Sorangium cellulosum]